MKASDLLYNHVFKELITLGFTQAHSEEGGAKAVRLWRRGTKHQDATARAIRECKKAHKEDLK